MNNYSVSDFTGSALAVLLFVPFLLAPGYVIAWIANCFGFRQLSVGWRMLVSVPLSIALCPIVSYWAGSLFFWQGLWIFYGAMFVALLTLLSGFLGHERISKWLKSLSKCPRASYFIAALWMVVVLCSLIDLQLGDKLYFSVTAYDYTVRTAITESIGRTGVRPSNPFYSLDGSAPLRYHYFWFMACSLVDQLGGRLINARQAMIGSAVWCGWGLIALVPLFFRLLFKSEAAALGRRSFLGVALFAVTGLDILPTIWLWKQGQAHPEMEWWNDQVTAWVGAVLWVPHHVATLVAGLTAVLLVFGSRSEPVMRKRVLQSVLAGFALATMVGSSIYVALVFAVFFSLWTFVSLLKRDHKLFATLTIAGLCAVILAVPYLRSLTGPGAGGSLVKFTVRHFYATDDWIHLHKPGGLGIAAIRLAVLPLNYFLEFGFFFAAVFLYLRNKFRSRSFQDYDEVLLLLAGTSTLMCTFLESGVIVNNDLGSRGFMPAQFVFLLWAAEVFAGHGESRIKTRSQALPHFGPLWATLLVLGLLGTIYEVGITRFYGLLADSGICYPAWVPDRLLGERTYSLRRAYDAMQKEVPSNGVIQNNPQWEYHDFFYGLYADRQTAAYDPACGAEFGGDPKKCSEFYPEISRVFNDGSMSADKVKELCHRLKINAVVLKDLDPAWKQRGGWSRQMQPAIADQYSRIYLF